jgi:hypothetical protein
MCIVIQKEPQDFSGERQSIWLGKQEFMEKAANEWRLNRILICGNKRELREKSKAER